MREFLHMGGYAPWVWSAMALTLVVLVANVVAAGRRYRRMLEAIPRAGSPTSTGGGA
jgi:heme exporter protein D